jgi:hypothetical protein
MWYSRFNGSLSPAVPFGQSELIYYLQRYGPLITHLLCNSTLLADPISTTDRYCTHELGCI